MSKFRVHIAVAAVCALTFASTAIFGQDNSAREKDRAEIEELMWRYTRALDSCDRTAYAAAYTGDGRFVAGCLRKRSKKLIRRNEA